MKFIETHAHLDYLKEFPLAEILERSLKEGIDKFVTIAVSPQNQDEVLKLAENYENIFCTQGLHPHEAKFWDKNLEEKIKKNLSSPKVKAIGEIGLDYHYNHSSKKEQREAFEAQLEIAANFHFQIVIHTREAEDDTIAILKNHLPKLKKRGIVHSFTSNETLARFALSEGFYLGFNGIVTFKAAQNVRNILAFTPLDQIVFETDCPFLAPIPHRGKENHPFYLPFITQKIAEVKGVPLETLCSQVYENSKTVFELL